MLTDVKAKEQGTMYPLARSTVMVLTAWIREQGEDDGARILFPQGRRSYRLSADAVHHSVGSSSMALNRAPHWRTSAVRLTSFGIQQAMELLHNKV